MTIRDNVEAVHRLLVEELKVTHLKAVIGFSMGAQQAFQWAVSYPELADRIVKDEFAFVTNNRVDFVRLFGRMELHAGLIIIVPNTIPAIQCALFEAPPFCN